MASTTNSFPLPSQLIEDSEEFKRCSPTEKLYLFHVLSRLNATQAQGKDSFFQADIEIAVTLGVSLKHIQRVRRKITKLGFLETTPGHKDRYGRGVATAYTGSKWLDVVEEIKTLGGDAGRFSLIHRFGFEAMLNNMRSDAFDAYDVVMWVYLFYLYQKYGGKQDFYVSKGELFDLTNIDIPRQERCLRSLYDKFAFSGGSHLFEYNDGYHKWEISKWAEWADPSQDDNNKQVQDKWRRQLKQKIRQAKTQAKTEEGRRLIDWYREQYRDIFGRSPSGYHSEHKATKAVEQYGMIQLKGLLEWYLLAGQEDLPITCKSKTRTLTDFLNNLEPIMSICSEEYLKGA
jgi:hypothetical protein